MGKTTALCILLGLLCGGAVSIGGGAEDKPPQEMTFKAKPGDVLFLHAKHGERVEGKCATCHDQVFKKDSSAPLNFKEKMHKVAEANKSSCATCHIAGGKAFEVKGNCKKCHGTAKS